MMITLYWTNTMTCLINKVLARRSNNTGRQICCYIWYQSLPFLFNAVCLTVKEQTYTNSISSYHHLIFWGSIHTRGEYSTCNGSVFLFIQASRFPTDKIDSRFTTDMWLKVTLNNNIDI